MQPTQFQRAVLAAASDKGYVTVAWAVLHIGLDARQTSQRLTAMVDDGVLELDSLDDGTLCYRSPGLDGEGAQVALALPQPRAITTWRDRLPMGTSGKALVVFGVVSILDLVGAGAAALLIIHKWEAVVLMWIALCGAPGTLMVVLWFLYGAIYRPR